MEIGNSKRGVHSEDRSKVFPMAYEINCFETGMGKRFKVNTYLDTPKKTIMLYQHQQNSSQKIRKEG